jgi:hypothetical protein
MLIAHVCIAQDDNLDEGDAADWMGHELSFVSTTSQPGAYVPGADDYVVVRVLCMDKPNPRGAHHTHVRVSVRVCVRAALQEDPLLEKGKGKFSKEEQKRRKRNNSWAGKSRD